MLIKGLYSMATDQAPALVQDGKIKNVREKLTMYSLFKQIEEGDADALGDEDLEGID